MKNGVTRRLLVFTVFLAALSAVLLCVAHAHRAIPVYTVQSTLQEESETAENAAGEKLNINKATREELIALPGIGETRADRIIEYRKANGGFYDVGELREVEGIGGKLLESLLPYICT